MARAILIAILLTAFALAGCAGDDDTDDTNGTSTQTGTGTGGIVSASGSVSVSGTGAPGNGSLEKTIVDNEYPDGTFTIKRGDTVTWTNLGNNPHSVTSDVIGAFDSNANCSPATTSACLQKGNEWSHKFDVAGVFPYHCKIHSSMTGTITVEN